MHNYEIHVNKRPKMSSLLKYFSVSKVSKRQREDDDNDDDSDRSDREEVDGGEHHPRKKGKQASGFNHEWIKGGEHWLQYVSGKGMFCTVAGSMTSVHTTVPPGIKSHVQGIGYRVLQPMKLVLHTLIP